MDVYKFSFYPRAIRLWNQLPATAVSAPSVAAFKEAALPGTIQVPVHSAPSFLLDLIWILVWIFASTCHFTAPPLFMTSPAPS